MNILRKFTADDADRLDASALRFAKRHGINIDIEHTEYTTEDGMGYLYPPPSPWYQVQHEVEYNAHLRRLWQGCFCRALGYKPSMEITIGWGNIGYNPKGAKR